MLNTKLIYKAIGSLLFIEAAMMSLCIAMSAYYNEDDIVPFCISVSAITAIAIILRIMGRKADNSMGRRDAYMLVTSTWVVFSVLGSLPFCIGGYIDNFTDAFLETVSGFTTTGASIIEDVEALPHGILFWRSMTQWIGGLGIVFFTIAVLPSLVGGSVKVFSAEATGPIKAKLHPRLSTTAKWIWTIYTLLTIGCLAGFYAFGMGAFDSINYAMTVTATGGFSTHNANTGYFRSAAIDCTAIFFMAVSGVSFTLLYLSLFKGQIKRIFQNSELKLYLAVIALFTAVIATILATHNGYGFMDAVRYALFQVVSFITTTGVFNDDAAKWPHITWVLLCFCMFLGGCSGSTSGGFKCMRGVMVAKVIRNEFKRILHPRAVLPVKINGNSVQYSQQVTLVAFFAIYILLCIVTYIVLISFGIDTVKSATIAISCVGNVGPTLGLEIGPATSWGMLPDAVKWVCSVVMLMGRLEIFSVIVLFTPDFWKDH